MRRLIALHTNGLSRMGSVNLVVIVESARSLITHGDGETNQLHIPSLISVAAALGMCADQLSAVGG